MSTNTLIEKIAADAEVEVQKIAAAADQEVAQIQSESVAAVAALKETAAADLAKQKEQQTLVATARAKQAGKLQVQTAKRAALDTLFSEVFAEMVAQDAAAYVAFFTTQAKQILPADIKPQTVLAPANRLTETADILAACNLAAPVEASDALQAGFIVTTADGLYDVSFERIFALQRPELEMAVVSQFLN